MLVHPQFNQQLFTAQQCYIVACSGGPDSMFLLQQLLNVAPALKLVVAHVNYQKRANSGDDARLVQQFCENNQLKFCLLTVTPKIYQQYPIHNFQAQARMIRYQFFAKLVTKYFATGVAVAHHYNDLIETFLMQQQRQGQVEHYGLQAVSKFCFNNEQIMVLRPLLKIKKSEIIQFLAKHKINYAVDQSNQSTQYLRNRIRQVLSETEFQRISQQIQTCQQQLNLEKVQAHAAIINQQFIDYPTYQTLNLRVKQRAIYYLLQAIIPQLLLKKQSKIIVEIVRQFDQSPRKDQIFVFSDQIKIKKTPEKIFVMLK